MNKKILAATIAAFVAGPTAALANDVTAYGVVHASVDYLDSDSDAIDGWDIASRASRLGFKGTEDLSNGLKAIWKMEFQVDIADAGTVAGSDAGAILKQVPALMGSPTAAQGNSTGKTVNQQDDLISARNMYIGLAGGWGTFLVGRHDTPYKMSTANLDLFADTLADYNSTLYMTDIRTGSAIAYVSPSFGGLTIAAAGVMPHAYGPQNGAKLSTEDADGVEALSIAAMFNANGFFASAAWEQLSGKWVNAWTGLGDDADDDNKYRLGIGYTGGGFTVGALWEDQESIYGISGFDKNSWQISAGYTFGNNMVKAMYGQASFDDDSGLLNYPDRTSWALGLDHNFSKRTKVYALYTNVDDDTPRSSLDTDLNGFSVGMVHSF